jgi:hypothetical protein
MPGYVDLPDGSWCRLECDTLTLAAGEARPVTVSLLVPDDRCHYNRHWCAAFSVRTMGEGTLGAAVYPYVYLETVSDSEQVRPPKATGDARALSPESPRGTDASLLNSDLTTDLESEPSGCLIVTPGILDAGDVPAGCTADAGIVITRNTYARDILLKVRPLVPETARLARRVLITPGHIWAQDTQWVQLATRSLLVPAGEEARFAVKVASPPGSKTINYRWEGFVAISASNGSHSLIRVRWRTTDAPAEAGLTSRRTNEGEGP